MNPTKSPLITEPLQGNGSWNISLNLKQRSKQRMTITVPAEVLERLRNAVYWTPGMTIAKVVCMALTHKLDTMERVNASPFPKRSGELKPGRPRMARNPVSDQIRPRIQMDNLPLQT